MLTTDPLEQHFRDSGLMHYFQTWTLVEDPSVRWVIDDDADISDYFYEVRAFFGSGSLINRETGEIVYVAGYGNQGTARAALPAVGRSAQG